MEKRGNLKGREKVSKMIRKCENKKENKSITLKGSNGITLIALVVTIVVLLILAGITINFIMNGNSVLNQALDARVQNKLGEIQDQARIIYSDLLIKKFKGDNDEISLIDIVTELRKQGYEIETRELSADTVTGITASPSELMLNKNETGKITIKYDGSDDGYLYYAKVEGKYYKIKMDETTLEVEREASNPEGTAVTATLEVESGYNTNIVANAQINGNEITITSGSTEGNITLTIKYGEELTTTCEVKVAPKVTKITLNKGTADVIIGENLQLTATVEPEYALDKEVTWSSSDETVVTVDQTGKVTGVKGGRAKITATAKDGSGVKAECNIAIESDWSEIAQIAKEIAEGRGKDEENGVVDNRSSKATVTVNGSSKTIQVGQEYYVKHDGILRKVRVMGFNHDLLTNPTATDGSGYGSGTAATKAGISFEFVEFMIDTGKQMCTENSNAGGWGSTAATCVMRPFLEGTEGIGKLSEACRTNIKQVKKTYITTYNTGATSTSNDKLWLLSCSEIWSKGRSDYSEAAYGLAKAKEGEQYKWYMDNEGGIEPKDPNTKLVKKTTSGSAYYWWLRSPIYNGSGYFCSVSTGGNSYIYDASGSFYVAPGFCI